MCINICAYKHIFSYIREIFEDNISGQTLKLNKNVNTLYNQEKEHVAGGNVDEVD